MNQVYTSRNFPLTEDLSSNCYICGKPKSNQLSKDHLIPRALFHPGSPHRPYLTVHPDCNNEKSTEDEKFAIRIMLAANRSTSAQQDLLPFLKRANEEINNGYLVGKSAEIRNYKLKRTIANELSESFSIIDGAKRLVEVKASEKHLREMHQYAIRMARGLFIRNVRDGTPNEKNAIILWHDYYQLNLHGALHSSMELVRHTLAGAVSNDTLFGQAWHGLVEYYGGKTDEKGTGGFVYIKFYDAMGIWVHFPTIAELKMTLTKKPQHH